tara:strand:- start:295 stop:444 length:150 start_codon:yes stop_codon:yes gene_type:complete
MWSEATFCFESADQCVVSSAWRSGMVFEVALYTMMLALVAITKDKTSLS